MRTDKLFLAATLAFGASAFDALAQGSDDGYVRSAPAGVFVKSPFGACVRTGYWTPAMANGECDPDLAPKPAAAAPSAPPPPPPAPAAAKPAPPKPTVVTLKSSELFDFNKATLTPAARAKLDSEVVDKIRQVRDLKFVNVNGHTDRLGSAQYNQKLSEKRAEAVKAYLVSKGVDGSKIETYGFGKTLPVKACPDQKNRKALIECLAPNRRVEVEIQGGPQ
ncbi:MAG TPA: OmpA family protein [Burkholderiales bacterium]|jgi:OOP family OmpA-OmpF porin|nr:OmpA family protein [Burkholderiales bacterium]